MQQKAQYCPCYQLAEKRGLTAPAGQSAMLTPLQQLAELWQNEMLSDAEFQQAKARLLGSQS